MGQVRSSLMVHGSSFGNQIVSQEKLAYLDLDAWGTCFMINKAKAVCKMDVQNCHLLKGSMMWFVFSGHPLHQRTTLHQPGLCSAQATQHIRILQSLELEIRPYPDGYLLNNNRI